MKVDYGELNVLFGNELLDIELNINHALVPITAEEKKTVNNDSNVAKNNQNVKIKQKTRKQMKYSEDDCIDRKRYIKKMYSRRMRAIQKKKYLEMMNYSQLLLESNNKLKNNILTLKIHVSFLLNYIILQKN
jgi:hypothetical protein